MGARLLIAAGEAASGGDALPVGVRMLIDGADEIMVVAPRLPGRLDWLSSATDAATERADERLKTVLSHLDELGAEASGRVGADKEGQAAALPRREVGGRCVAGGAGNRGGSGARGGPAITAL